jgi:hypothetical protein
MPRGFDYAGHNKSNGTRSIAAHPFDKLRAGSCKKRRTGAGGPFKPGFGLSGHSTALPNIGVWPQSKSNHSP